LRWESLAFDDGGLHHLHHTTAQALVNMVASDLVGDGVEKSYLIVHFYGFI